MDLQVEAGPKAGALSKESEILGRSGQKMNFKVRKEGSSIKSRILRDTDSDCKLFEQLVMPRRC